ncbi:MAG: 4-(cytidine 5'-diphospho)-2-C-methyl-D-erythritol kinase [Desulfovibrio sp.]|nr:4-(cytidine 5'-diphospho)-2-C-methyl-D-erythritol kinase [Desulfovibrio sp.]
MIALSTGCKINLGLRVTGRRADGYHELHSLFWPLAEPCDRLEILPASRLGLRLVCSHTAIDPVHNTLIKAYKLFCEATGYDTSLEVHLSKGIPPGSGLGGGSSDAACLLRWLNTQIDSPLSREALSHLAVRVGADTPFFLYGCPCMVQGIGEKITPLKSRLTGLTLVLICPELHVSTAWAFTTLDSLEGAQAPLHVQCEKPAMQNSLTKNDSEDNGFSLSGAEIVQGMCNDLENAVFPHYPQLAAIKAELLRLGADAAAMSGSGSSMVGLFSHKQAAREAGRKLGRVYDRVWCLPLEYTGM